MFHPARSVIKGNAIWMLSTAGRGKECQFGISARDGLCLYKGDGSEITILQSGYGEILQTNYSQSLVRTSGWWLSDPKKRVHYNYICGLYLLASVINIRITSVVKKSRADSPIWKLLLQIVARNDFQSYPLRSPRDK